MTKLEKEMLKQRISLYEYMINSCIVTQNINNFNRLKEELFQDLIKKIKEMK